MQCRYFTIGALISLMTISVYAQDVKSNYTKYVDPFIGVENKGNTFPGVSLPYGMVKLGPDCYRRDTNSGYHPTGDIWGFSHTHVSGTGGGPKYGNVLLTATMGNLNIIDYSSMKLIEASEVIDATEKVVELSRNEALQLRNNYENALEKNRKLSEEVKKLKAKIIELQK